MKPNRRARAVRDLRYVKGIYEKRYGMSWDSLRAYDDMLPLQRKRMNTSLANRFRNDLAQRLGMSREQLELIRRTCIGANAPDDVLELYLAKCRALGVDPLDRMIHVIPRRANVKDEMTGEWRSELRWTFQAAIDLYRSVAEDSGDYAGQLGPLWSDDGKEWTDTWLSKEPPAVCKVGILRKSFNEPLWVTGTYDYYVPRDAKGNPNPSAFWKGEKGAHQLAKCVEELGLRKAFPRKLRGVYGDEEMQQAGKPAILKAPREEARDEVADAKFEALPAGGNEQKVTAFRIAESSSRSTKPVEFRRKAAFGAIQKFQDLTYNPTGEEVVSVIPDHEYRELLISEFGVVKFTDTETGEVKPTKSALPIEDLEHLWLILRDIVKHRAPDLL